MAQGKFAELILYLLQVTDVVHRGKIVLLDRQLVRILVDLALDLVDGWLGRFVVDDDALCGLWLLVAEESWLAFSSHVSQLTLLEVVKFCRHNRL